MFKVIKRKDFLKAFGVAVASAPAIVESIANPIKRPGLIIDVGHFDGDESEINAIIKLYQETGLLIWRKDPPNCRCVDYKPIQILEK